jgi:hypothetical protein
MVLGTVLEDWHLNTEQRRIPILLRVASSVAFLLFATLAALSGVRGSSTMAWVAFALFLALGLGIASGKFTVPSLLDKSHYRVSSLVFLVISVYLTWLIASKLVL